MIGPRRIRFHASSSLIELETLDRAIPKVSAISSAVTGASDKYSRPWIWLTERLTPHSSPMSPQCRTNRSTAGGNFFLPVISVMTEISDGIDGMSRAKKAPFARRKHSGERPILVSGDGHELAIKLQGSNSQRARAVPVSATISALPLKPLAAVGAVAAGIALLEVALVPGLVLGAAAVLAPNLIPSFGRRSRRPLRATLLQHAAPIAA